MDGLIQTNKEMKFELKRKYVVNEHKTLKAGQAVKFEKQPADKGFHAINIQCAEQTSDNNVDHDDFISVEEEPSFSYEQQNSANKTQTSQFKEKESV